MGNLVQIVPPRCPRYLSLDLWRGVACLCVVIYHSTNIHAALCSTSGSGGWTVAIAQELWIGVPVFFVISGYCITAASDSSRRRSHSTKEFFFRRFRRIYPPFWVVLVCAVTFIGLVELIWPGFFFESAAPILRPWWFSPSQWLGNSTLTESWRYHVGGSQKGYFLSVIWTLCYEEQFYAVTGLILLLGRRHFFGGAVLITVATIIVGNLSQYYGISISGFFFDGFWLLFAAGILVYYRINYATRSQALLINLLLAIAVAASIFGLPLIHAQGGHIAYHAPVGFSFALLISLIHRWDSVLRNMRCLRSLFFCGTLCYSMYLVHMPIVVAISQMMHRQGVVGHWSTILITMPLCVSASILAAWFFHLVVERRFLNPAQTAEKSTEQPQVVPATSPPLLT